jgi:hypothetical protein
MTAWTTISNALVQVGAKPFATTVQAFRDNVISAFEGDATAVAAGVTLRLPALQRLVAGTSVRTNQTGPFVVNGSTFTAATGWAFIQSGTIRISVRHYRTGGGDSEVRIQRVRAGSTTTLTTLTTSSGSPGATQTYDADVISGDLILLQNRNSGINTSTIDIIEQQVDAAVSLWPTNGGGGAISTFGLVQGNP